MRDVILVRRASKVKLGKTKRGHYTTRFEPNVGGFVLPVDRGWASVEAKLGKKKVPLRRHPSRGVRRSEDPRGPGGVELTKGPLKTKRSGGSSSATSTRASPATTSPSSRATISPSCALAGFGMKDNGAIQSCCYPSLFDPNGVFDHTVDHVLSKPGSEEGSRPSSPATSAASGRRQASGRPTTAAW